MNIEVQYINACQFSDGTVRTTVDMKVNGQQGRFVFVTDSTEPVKAFAKANGLEAPKYAGKKGVSKKGKHQGQEWHVFTSGTKPNSTNDDADIDF